MGMLGKYAVVKVSGCFVRKLSRVKSSNEESTMKKQILPVCHPEHVEGWIEVILIKVLEVVGTWNRRKLIF
jgi:hypothetical protein